MLCTVLAKTQHDFVRATVRVNGGEHQAALLIDTGSTLCFIPTEIVRRWNVTPKKNPDPISVKLADGSTVQCHTYLDTQVVLYPDDVITRARFWVLDNAIEPILGNDWLVQSRAWVGKHRHSIEFEGVDGAVVMVTKQAALRDNPPTVTCRTTSPERAGCTTLRAGACSRAPPIVSVPHEGTKKSSAHQSRDLESPTTTRNP